MSTSIERSTTETTRAREASAAVAVPYTDISTVEMITLGFRQSMLGIADKDGVGIAAVTTGAGCGSDAITLACGDRNAVVYGIDLLRAWVETFDPKLAEALPDPRADAQRAQRA